jgi:hypothetical protein
VLAAPGYAHLAYRPGVPLVDTVLASGRVVVSGGQNASAGGAT